MNKNLITLIMLLSLAACSADDTETSETISNSPATFSGISTGEIINTSTDTISHTLVVDDIDDGESFFKAVTNLATDYGTFSLTTNGAWTYQLDVSNSDVLAQTSSSDSLTDTITIESVDGTRSTVSITIKGVTPTTSVSNASFGNSGREESIASNSEQILNVQIWISDEDGESEEAAITQNNVATKYGTFSIATDSGDTRWEYNLNNDHTDVKALTAESAPLTDIIPIFSLDGTESFITITITGPDFLDTSMLVSDDAVPDINCTEVVSSISALEDAAEDIVAGDTLCLADGTYTGDFELRVEGAGTSDNPITVAAQHSGQTIINDGEISVRIGGEYVVIQGFVFRDGKSGSSIIKFESDEACNYCRVTEVSIIDMDNGDYGSSKWVEFYGHHNRVDHSWFSGKESRGALMVFGRWTSEEDFNANGFPADYAMIDHNYFGDRAPAWGRGYAGASDNEYEGIRIGLSTTHSAPSYTSVEYNYFERIQGEAEIISNKSANNFIRNNTIRDSNGSIVTRHGAQATISNNFIFGDDNPFSGGIRLVDDGHIVTNNYIEGARFLSSNWNGGIVLTTGDGSGDTDNGYQDVSNVLVAYNTIVDSVNSLNVSGGKNSHAPKDVYFVNNIIADAIGPVIRTNDEDMPSSSIFAGNYVYGQSFSDDNGLTAYSGISFVDPELNKDSDGLYRPGADVNLAADSNADTGSFTLPSIDMDGQTRSTATTSGADEILATDITMQPLTADDVGPKNYRPTLGKVYVQKVEIANHDFDSGDFTGWTNTGAVITTTPEDVFSRGNSLKIDSATAIVEQTVTLTANTNYTLSAFTKGSALLGITLNDGTQINKETEYTSYKFDSVTFNSGDNTSATVVAKLPNTLAVQADIVNADFSDSLNGWVVVENNDAADGLGDVGDSSDSAVIGSRAAKFNYRYANDNNSTPGLYQDVTVLPNTDYNLSMYVLVKSKADGTTATFGVKNTADESIIASKVADYEVLESAGAPKGSNKDHYQDVVSFNSGSATSVRIFAQMDAREMDAAHIPADATTQMEDDHRKVYEIRVDDFELSYEDVPPSGSEAFFDSIRLVSHPLSEAGSIAAENE